VCKDSDHHWLEDIDDETGEPILVCKHCPATKPWVDLDDEDLDDEDEDDLWWSDVPDGDGFEA
jgi:hypothetical protein